MHQPDIGQEMRERVGKGQEEGLTTPKISAVRGKGATGTQSDRMAVLLTAGEMLQSPGCMMETVTMAGLILWMSRKGWLQDRQGSQSFTIDEET